MKKAIPAILLLTVVFFGLASCKGGYIDPGALEMSGEDLGGGGGGGGDIGGPGGPGSGGGGTFTLTGIPSQHNGRYASLTGDNDVNGCQSTNMSNRTAKLVQIVNGEVHLPMWTLNTSGKIVKYSGNDTVSGRVDIFNSATVNVSSTPIAERFFSSITFSNGSATKDWSQGSNW